MSDAFKIAILSFFLASCSSLKRTVVYSSLAGGLASSLAGAALSPTKKDRGANAVVFGLLGAGVSGVAGYALYKDDPRNYKLKHMLKGQERPNTMNIGLGPLNLNAQLNKDEIYQVPVKELPKELRGKVGKQYLIKYQAKERYIKKGPKTYYIPSFSVFEYSYGEGPNQTEAE